MKLDGTNRRSTPGPKGGCPLFSPVRPLSPLRPPNSLCYNPPMPRRLAITVGVVTAWSER